MKENIQQKILNAMIKDRAEELVKNLENIRSLKEKLLAHGYKQKVVESILRVFEERRPS